ncbi:MAG: hypothetical protein ABWK01_03275 [Infirmifilum sp.]
MSKEPEIDWGLVAKKIVQTLGVETARGLYYGFMAQAVTPFLMEKVRDMVAGGSEEKKIQELRELLARQGLLQQPPPTQNPDELARALAQILPRVYGGQVSGVSAQPLPYQPPGSYPPIQPPQPPMHPPQPPPNVREDIERLKSEIAHYESIKRDLERKFYTELDESNRELIRKRMQEIENELTPRKLRLQTLQAAWGTV